MKRIFAYALILFFVTPVFITGLDASFAMDDASLSDESPVNTNVETTSMESIYSAGYSSTFFTQTYSSDDGFYYVCRRGTSTIAYFGESQVVYVLDGTTITLEFSGSQNVIPDGETPTGSVTNYLLGNDQSAWKSNVVDYTVMRYTDLYPGIDLVYRIQDGSLKYEFLVSPNASPDQIQMRYIDADSVTIGENFLTVTKDGQHVTDSDFYVYQNDVEITESSFVLLDMDVVSFNIAEYTPSVPLIIDPVLIYSSYLGGSDTDEGIDIAVEDGYAYVTGITKSSDFDTYNAYNSTYGGDSRYDIFVTKFSADGGSLIYSTYLGGSDNDYSSAIFVQDGVVYIAGYSESSNFPHPNAYDSTYNSVTEKDGIIAILTDDGQTLAYGTYLGGIYQDYCEDIFVQDGYIYVTGETSSPDFPMVSAYNATYSGTQDVFFSKFSVDGSSLLLSTYLGGKHLEYGKGLVVEDGYAYIAGYTRSSNFPTTDGALDTVYADDYGQEDGFVTKFNIDGQSLNYSTFLGGTYGDFIYDLAIENGEVSLIGYTQSSDYPVTPDFDDTVNGDYRQFMVTRLDTSGSSIVHSTYLGGSNHDEGYCIAVENGFTYVAGYSQSTDIPLKDAMDTSLDGLSDCYVAMFSADYDLVYASYIGGSGSEAINGLAVEQGCVFITGDSHGGAFPVVNAYDASDNGGTDAIVAKISAADSDGDNLSNYDESIYETDPYRIDSDCDMLDDYSEVYIYGTNPLISDSDMDSYSDAQEVAEGTDPLDPYSYPDATYASNYQYAYGSYLGGSSTDRISSICVEDGYIYIGGSTFSSNFPMINAMDSTHSTSTWDAFIVKMAANGQSIMYSTYIGSTENDVLTAIDVLEGYVYACGYTYSSGFPTQLPYDASLGGSRDGFVFKLDSDGSQFIYSTFLGGTQDEDLWDICVENGFVYVTGSTKSIDYPVVSEYSTGDGDSSHWDIVVTKFDTDGQSLNYSTYIGASDDDYGRTIDVNDGYAFIGGMTTSSDYPLANAFDTSYSYQEGIITELSQNGSTLVLSSFWGGHDGDSVMAVEVLGEYLYLCGSTSSDDFPLQNPLFDTMGGLGAVFLTRIDLSDVSIMFSTYLTGAEAGFSFDEPRDLTLSGDGSIFVVGYTSSSDFPITTGPTPNGFTEAAFVSKFTPTGDELLYSRCFTGNADTQTNAIDIYNGIVYFGGSTEADNFETIISYSDTYAGGSQDAFLAILDIDSDCDALADFTEDFIGTSPILVDSDGDNFLDGYEVRFGSDPLDETSYPSMPQNWYDAIYDDLDGNATLVQNLITWVDGNTTLLENVMLQLDANATLITEVISWLDGNSTAIENLFTYLDGNATLLMTTMDALDGNSTLIQNLLTWSAGNATLLLNVIDEVDTLNATDVSQLIAWLDGNYTAIETLFKYVEGNATLLLNTIDDVNENTAELSVLAALISGNTAALNSINASHINDFDELRAVIDELGISVGDSDYDGLDDLEELEYGTDPLCIDTDTDNLNDAFEIRLGTDPLDDDSDADSYLDGLEYLAGSDPLDPLSFPEPTDTTDPLLLFILASAGIGSVILIVFILNRRKSS